MKTDYLNPAVLQKHITAPCVLFKHIRHSDISTAVGINDRLPDTGDGAAVGDESCSTITADRDSPCLVCDICWCKVNYSRAVLPV